MSHSFHLLSFRPGRLAALFIVALPAMLALSGQASAQVTYLNATTLKAIKIARGPDASTINSSTWANLPGGSINFTVPPGETDVFTVRFTAESVCWGTSGWCSVRALVNGVEAAPTVGLDFAFDSTDDGAATSFGWKSHAVDRSKYVTNNGVTPLTVTVLMQYATTSSTISLRLDDWQFTVEQFK